MEITHISCTTKWLWQLHVPSEHRSNEKSGMLINCYQFYVYIVWNWGVAIIGWCCFVRYIWESVWLFTCFFVFFLLFVNENFSYRILPFSTKNWLYLHAHNREFKSLFKLIITFVLIAGKGTISRPKIFWTWELFYIRTFSYKYSGYEGNGLNSDK